MDRNLLASGTLALLAASLLWQPRPLAGRQIAPGQYKLFAWENVTTGAYQNAAFISKYEQQGSSISVNAATTTSAQLNVIAAEK